MFHQLENRIDAHIFVAFLAFCLHATLRQRLRALAPGLTPRAVLAAFATVPMIDVQRPTTNGRELLLTRYTEPEKDPRLLIKTLKLQLPHPTVTPDIHRRHTRDSIQCSEDLCGSTNPFQCVSPRQIRQSAKMG